MACACLEVGLQQLREQNGSTSYIIFELANLNNISHK
jgi:hypothetical protein